MTAKPHVRRPLVVAGVILTLFGAVATVRAASEWVSKAAPLQASPASISSIERALADQQARSAALQGQLDAMLGSSRDLEVALAQANSHAAADKATAAQLEASLAAAQAKLATLEAALRASQSGATTTPASAPAPRPGGGDD